eukprot:306653-Chlamydomonas_euryale.AAC.1
MVRLCKTQGVTVPATVCGMHLHQQQSRCHVLQGLKQAARSPHQLTLHAQGMPAAQPSRQQAGCRRSRPGRA